MDRAKLVALSEDLLGQHGLDVRGWRLAFRTTVIDLIPAALVLASFR